MKVHPVFHVSNLKAYHEDPADPSRNLETRATICRKPPAQRKVEEILADRIVTVSRKHHQEYLVKWEDLGPEEISWERECDLKCFRRKIEEYLATKSTGTSTD